jgi:hypothetical protein
MESDAEKAEEKNKTRILCSVTPPPPENRDVYEILWQNVVELVKPQMTI